MSSSQSSYLQMQGYTPLLLAILQGNAELVKAVLSGVINKADLTRMISHQVCWSGITPTDRQHKGIPCCSQQCVDTESVYLFAPSVSPVFAVLERRRLLPDQAWLIPASFLNFLQVPSTSMLGRGLPERGGGWTPLLLACEEGHLAIVKELLSHGLAKSQMTKILEATSAEVSKLVPCFTVSLQPVCFHTCLLLFPSCCCMDDAVPSAVLMD